MQIVFAVIALIVFFATIVSLGNVDMGNWLKAAVVVPLLFLVVYSLARIQPKN